LLSSPTIPYWGHTKFLFRFTLKVYIYFYLINLRIGPNTGEANANKKRLVKIEGDIVLIRHFIFIIKKTKKKCTEQYRIFNRKLSLYFSALNEIIIKDEFI
jgi:hypothetical protein